MHSQLVELASMIEQFHLPSPANQCVLKAPPVPGRAGSHPPLRQDLTDPDTDRSNASVHAHETSPKYA
jgi:hypothetical protein